MILALVLLTASFLVFFNMIEPAYSDVVHEKGVAASTAALLATEQQIVSQAQALLGEYTSNSAAENNLALAMPSGPDLSSALAQIYGIAQNNGITVQSMNFTAPTVQAQTVVSAAGNSTSPFSIQKIVKPVGTFSIQLNAAGSYENMKNFLAQMETNIRIFDLTALSFQGSLPPLASAKNAPPAADLFSYNMTLTTYYQLP